MQVLDALVAGPGNIVNHGVCEGFVNVPCDFVFVRLEITALLRALNRYCGRFSGNIAGFLVYEQLMVIMDVVVIGLVVVHGQAFFLTSVVIIFVYPRGREVLAQHVVVTVIIPLSDIHVLPLGIVSCVLEDRFYDVGHVQFSVDCYSLF